MPQFHIKRRTMRLRPGFPRRHHPNRFALDEALTQLHSQPVEAGQHHVIATAAIDDQQKPVTAETISEHNPAAAWGDHMSPRWSMIRNPRSRAAIGLLAPAFHYHPDNRRLQLPMRLGSCAN